MALVAGLLGLLLVPLTARDRRRGVWGSGIALAGAGGALLAGWIGARTLTLEGFDTSWGDAVVKTIWDAYLGDLRAWSLGIAGAGIIIAAAAARPEPHGRPSWSQIPAPLRGVMLLVTGAVVLADRELALDLAAVGAAGVLLYLGARHLLAGPGRLALAGAALVILTAALAGRLAPRAARRATRRPRRARRAGAAARGSGGG